MRFWIIPAFFFLLLQCDFNFEVVNAQSAKSIIKEMIEQSKQVNTLQYRFLMQERIKGKMVKRTGCVKINNNPYKFYLNQESPLRMEVLYVTGCNNGKLLISMKDFPWLTISLGPEESRVRDDQHHSVFEAGFNYVASVLEYLLNKYPDLKETQLKYLGIVTLDEKECYKISFDNSLNYKYINYTVKKGETITDIAKRLKLNDHLIVELNKKVKHLDDIKQGQIIVIPTDYAQKMEIFIDKIKMVPIAMKVFDDKGLYEEFFFLNIKLDAIYDQKEFTHTYKDYDF